MSHSDQKSLLDRLGEMLFGEDDALADRAAAQPTRLPPRPGVTAPANVEVQQAKPASVKVPAGTMQLIGLDGLKQKLGEAWTASADRVSNIVDNVLRRRLDITDVHYRVNSDTYLILFTRLDRRAAGFKAKVIADEIERLVLGEVPPGSGITVLSAVAEVDRGIILEKIHSLPELVQYVRDMAEAEALHPRAASPMPGDVLLFDNEPAPSLTSDQPAARSAPVVTGAGPDLADLDQPLLGLFQQKTLAAFLKECRAGFYPAYSIKRHSFSPYMACAIHEPSHQLAHLVNDPLVEGAEELPFQIDRYVLTSSLLGLHRMLNNGGRGIVVANVGFDTLAGSRHREVYFARLREIPAAVAKYLGFALRDIPAGTPSSRVAEILAYLQPFGSTRILHVATDFRLVDLYCETGCHAFSTSLAFGDIDPARRHAALSTFTKRAHLHNLESVLTDVDGQEDVTMGTAAGFTYLVGKAVAGLVETPGLVSGTGHSVPHASAMQLAEK
ncbi:hypothetical protein [Ferrovibrio sp.]|uniref:hypothetical protein n=1 Tax=Ferrovibrio sp. TaxID=1917215 RepID=UPI003D0B3CDD